MSDLLLEYENNAEIVRSSNKTKEIKEAVDFFQKLTRTHNFLDKAQVEKVIGLGLYRTGNVKALKELKFERHTAAFIQSLETLKREKRKFLLSNSVQYIGGGSLATLFSFALMYTVAPI